MPDRHPVRAANSIWWILRGGGCHTAMSIPNREFKDGTDATAFSVFGDWGRGANPGGGGCPIPGAAEGLLYPPRAGRVGAAGGGGGVATIVAHIAEDAGASRFYTKEDMVELRERVRAMFQHAYEGYIQYASDYDELRPLTCDGVNPWGSYSLTLIDALDTLVTVGNYTEFRRMAKLIETIDFDKDINVSVFETNIRIVGDLLSAHMLSRRAGVVLEEGWPCEGPLLRLAEDVAHRLLPAFDTATGMPYGTVNLRYGVPQGETSVTCTAGVGTFLVEFGALSGLTGNTICEDLALNAVYALWERRSPIGLLGNHIDAQTGRWTALDSGIGAGVDSFFEYLAKGAIRLNRPELMEMFHEARKNIDKYLKRDDWYVWANMYTGQVTLPVFQSLEAFWPGVLSLFGDISPAMRTLVRYSTVWRKYGFLPEFYTIPLGEASPNREIYPLRPELIESVMYLYRATKNQFLLELGEDMLHSIEFSAKTRCGYATIRNVVTHQKENRMESFFLAETTKYLYLLFDENNLLHNDGGVGERQQTPYGECAVNAGSDIFNTEAHPVDMSALHCCHDIKADIFDDLEFKRLDRVLSALNNLTNYTPTLNRKESEGDDDSVRLMSQQMKLLREDYEQALINTTAMQELLLKILINEIQELRQEQNDDNEQSYAQPALLLHVRRIVEIKKRMVETFERLQALMAEGGPHSSHPNVTQSNEETNQGTTTTTKAAVAICWQRQNLLVVLHLTNHKERVEKINYGIFHWPELADYADIQQDYVPWLQRHLTLELSIPTQVID
ncbi:ER degradation-enhancing alpha-mannosidase-like protein 2 [Eurosta solidaginis]|uniref:ER degradation-enhancing alpha-mannosidase-like protein 2 n=1 Tax=Eurosta solidaginis TaxID=178769 RepID=UPI0035316B07